MKKQGEQDPDYEVGFGKPPKASQFQKGQSGNPGGKQKRPVHMVEVLREGLSQTIHVIENGKRKKITKMQAVFNRIIDKSIAGDTSASRVLLMFAHVLNDAANASPAELEELDKKALRSLFENYGLKPPEE